MCIRDRSGSAACADGANAGCASAGCASVGCASAGCACAGSDSVPRARGFSPATPWRARSTAPGRAPARPKLRAEAPCWIARRRPLPACRAGSGRACATPPLAGRSSASGWGPSSPRAATACLARRASRRSAPSRSAPGRRS
eukprot:3597342-Prymnesium_polylepis.1